MYNERINDKLCDRLLYKLRNFRISKLYMVQYIGN